MRTLLFPILVSLAAGVLLASSGCSAEHKKAGHLKQGDQYLAAGDYEKADIEYRNVLQIEPFNPSAVAQLGIIYFEQGRLSQMGPYLLKARELQPDNLEVRAKLGLLYLATGRVKEAHEEALFILERKPDHPDAPLLLVESSAEPAEIEAARQKLTALPPPVNESASVLVALGSIELRQQRYAPAKALFEKALSQDPSYSSAHAALALLYRAQNNVPEMEKALKRASETATAHSPRKLLYPKFLIQSGRAEEGRDLLEAVIKEAPDNLAALMMLADLGASEKKYDESESLVNKVLTRDPSHPEALLLRARVKLVKGDKAEALEEMEKMARVFPKSAQVHYQLGMAQYASGDRIKAEASLHQAIAIAPNYTEAILLLADLHLKQRNFAAVISTLTPLAKERPEIAHTRILLAEAYRSQGNLNEALGIYRELEKAFPRNPQTPLLIGSVLLQQNQRAEAREAFSRALELAPNYLVAVDQLTNLDLTDKNYPAARQRVDTLIAKNPTAPGGYLLRAKIAFAQQDTKTAESALLKAIELRPETAEPYLLLGRLYNSTNQQAKALENFQAAATRNPQNVEVLMMIGTMQEQQKKALSARETYEKVLAINPKFSPALNNLAYLYAEQLNELEKAQELAQKARDLLPHDPNIADTLGWILFRQRQYFRALTLLQESAAKLSQSAEVLFHLGMAHYMLGEETAAQNAFQRAIALNQDFSGKKETQERLALLALDPESTTGETRAVLEKALGDRPDDPVALIRLAAIHERSGARDKAIANYQKALQASPNHRKASLQLVRLYMAEKDSARALELARNVRKTYPDDPEVALVLGRLAYETGDYPWAFSLLQQASEKKPEDSALLFELAESAYSVGRVTEAEEIARRALQGGALFLRAAEARRLLELIAIANQAQATPASTASIEASLKANPHYAPALMARAVLSEQGDELKHAIETYEVLLKQYPDFSPAKRRLAILYAEKSDDVDRAYELAIKARPAFPDDAELAKATGILLYRQRDFNRAVSTLQNASRQRPDDAELAYYLGMAQLRGDKTTQGRESLQRALSLNLRSDLKTEAEKALAEE